MTVELDGPVLAYDHDRALDDSGCEDLFDGSVLFADLLVRVDQEREWETEFADELLMAVCVGMVDSEYDCIGLREFGPIIPNMTELDGASGRHVSGVEDQDHGFLACKIA